MSDEITYLSRGMDYLGELGARLRDLQGYTTLAYELIQNAEDSSNASSISFDVWPDELVVDNDGTFSDCGRVKELHCPWKTDESRGYLCDFHGFRLVAGGHKRELRNTIGAFGVGFTSVYQITDAPHVISGGRHWIIHEEMDENNRITVCGKCDGCQRKDLPGTRFILPWAKDPSSELRRRLRADPVRPDVYEEFPRELSTSLSDSLLFLKNILEIRILKDGIIQRIMRREPLGAGFVIGDAKNNQQWFVLRGTFDQAAKELKREHIGRIEAKRSAEVAIAIPAESIESGLLFAFLPSQHETGLKFHINADFYPASDRKRINFEAGYELEWNTEAVRTAAYVLSKSLIELRESLDPKQFWSVMASCYEASNKNQDTLFSVFWDALLPELKTASVIYTSAEQWKPAGDSRIIREDSENKAVPILEEMGVALVHKDLRAFFNPLRSIGVSLVEVADITKALSIHGLTTRVAKEQLPTWIRSEESILILWQELSLLIGRAEKKARKQVEQEILKCAIAPISDGALLPCRDVYVAEEKTVALFGQIDPSIPFLDKRAPDVEEVSKLIPRFTAQAAVHRLAVLAAHNIFDTTTREKSLIPAVLRWFESQRQEILASSTLQTALAGLPIFPTASGPKPLSKLSLPGGFVDHLGLANLVDVTALEGRSEFLRDLDAKELTFQQYAQVSVPEAWASETLTVDIRRQVVKLLALRLGEIRDDNKIKAALRKIDLVECGDGVFRRATDVYFSSEIVRAVLGSEASYAQLGGEHKQAISDLYAWLGTHTKPDLSDVIAHITTLTSLPPNIQSKNGIEQCVNYLGDVFLKDDTNKKRLADLKVTAWLPGRSGDESWRKPNEVFTLFRQILFASQATFLGLPLQVQQSNAKFLEFLGVRSEPSVIQVVQHLAYCSERETPVKMEVYRFLNEHAQDSIIPSLRMKRCLLLGENRYESPDRVFWGPHPFGRMRIQLSSEWRKYNDLLTRLDIEESAKPADAISVISEVAKEFGRENRPLEDWASSALMAAWAILDVALLSGAITEDYFAALTSLKVIPNAEGVLQRTEGVLFEDRSGLAGKFGTFLATSAILRPSEAWRAMAAAGVRTLSKAVEVEIIECVDPVADEDVVAVLQGRSIELTRVLDTHMEGQDPQSLRRLLQEIRCERVAELSIRFTIKAFNQVRHSEPEDVPALYQAESKTLYFVEQNGHPPWPSIARELALALFPDEEPGRLAPGFKEVLAAETEEAARQALNEFGFAAVGVFEPVQDSESMAGEFGATEGEQADEQFIDASELEKVEPDAAKPDEAISPEDAVKRMLGAAPEPTPIPPELVPPEPAIPARHQSENNSDRKHSKSPSRKQGRLRSYVVKGETKSGAVDEEFQKVRTEVDKAGIAYVVRFEKACGRNPKVKAQTNEGYDIESLDAGGSIVRYIEVKSLSGLWGTLGVSVHRSQFKFAQKLGKQYWLYVVENALSATPSVYRINDPARSVDDFLFDYDWHEIAEPDIAEVLSGED